jgi:predicted kinase
MPYAIFLIGLPASGKSTFIKQEKFKNFKVLSSDNILDQIAKDNNTTYDKIFKDHIKIADQQFRQEFQDAIKNKENIIIDRTNLNPKSRQKLLDQIPDSYEKIAIIFEISEAEQTIRLNKRAKEEGKTIPPEVIKNMKQSYVPPSKEEGFSKILKNK